MVIDSSSSYFANKFTYLDWVPQGLSEQYPTIEPVLDELESDPSLDAAFAAFWLLLKADYTGFAESFLASLEGLGLLQQMTSERATDLLKEHSGRDDSLRTEINRRLSGVVETLRQTVSRDEIIPQFQVMRFVHIVGALVLSEQDVNKTDAGRSWQLVQSALCVLENSGNERSPLADIHSRFPMELEVSLQLVKAWLWSNRFHSFLKTGDSFKALECLGRATDSCDDADNVLQRSIGLDRPWNITAKLGHVSRYDEKTGAEVTIAGSPGIHCVGAGYDLVEDVVGVPSAAVEAFEELYYGAGQDVDWKRLAKYCRALKLVWVMDERVFSKLAGRQTDLDIFWDQAEALCLQKKTTPAQTDPKFIESLIDKAEGSEIEFKATFRWNIRNVKNDKAIQTAALKEMVAFLNGDGGHLLIGVEDEEPHKICGIDLDGFKSHDHFQTHIANQIKDRIGPEFGEYLRLHLVPIRQETVLNVECRKLPLHMTDFLDEDLYIRNNNTTIKLTPKQTATWQADRMR